MSEEMNFFDEVVKLREKYCDLIKKGVSPSAGNILFVDLMNEIQNCVDTEMKKKVKK